MRLRHRSSLIRRGPDRAWQLPASELKGQAAQTGYRRPGKAADPLKQQAHNDRVPEFAAGSPVLPCPPPFLGEAALAVERDRGRVLREHLQAQLVQALGASPVDRRL